VNWGMSSVWMDRICWEFFRLGYCEWVGYLYGGLFYEACLMDGFFCLGVVCLGFIFFLCFCVGVSIFLVFRLWPVCCCRYLFDLGSVRFLGCGF